MRCPRQIDQTSGMYRSTSAFHAWLSPPMARVTRSVTGGPSRVRTASMVIDLLPFPRAEQVTRRIRGPEAGPGASDLATASRPRQITARAAPVAVLYRLDGSAGPGVPGICTCAGQGAEQFRGHVAGCPRVRA